MQSESGLLISQIGQMTTRVIDRLITENGTDAFSAAQGRILAILWENDGIIMQELAARTGLAQNTLTTMVDRISKKGLCERRTVPDDRRKSRVCLTEKGKSLRPVFERITDRMYDLYFEGFDQEEVVQLDQLLRRVVRNLEHAL